jgi:O-antigen/teichoic acid export membrane protein
MLVALSMGLLIIIINFVTQRFFLDSLGLEYLGLNGLFTNVIAMLSVVELGLGAAVIYHLYKPLRDNDQKLVSSLMTFYKKGYRLIALIIFIIGILFMPFLPLVIGENSIGSSVSIIYLLFIMNVTVSYLLSYKRSILYADQKNYLINIVHMAMVVIFNALQIWALLATSNYYLYLVIKIVMTISENLLITTIVNRKYHFNSGEVSLDSDIKKDIFKKIKGLFYHKMGDFLVLGSSNIIISVILGIATVGLYSNYLLIQMAITSLFSQLTTAIKASVGNLLVDSNKEASGLVFRRLQFANQALAVLVVSVFFVVSAPFVTVWLGAEYVLGFGVVAALSLNIYLILVRAVFGNFKDAAGIFYEDRYVPLVESAINIILSIIFVHFLGLAGAFIGTAISSLALHAYSYPKYVYKGVLGRSYAEYLLLMIKNGIIAISAVSLTYFISSFVSTDSDILKLIFNALIAVSVPCVILWIVYRKSDEYKYFKLLLAKIILGR